MNLEAFSDYIVYVDESGHASPDPDPNFPCFVLAFCLFEKKHYLDSIVPGLQRLKFDFFGHDMVIFHEREIRKSTGEFSVLLDRRVRTPFFAALNGLLEEAQFAILHSTLIKNGAHQKDDNLYHIATLACLEALYEKLTDLQPPTKRPTSSSRNEARPRIDFSNSISEGSAQERTSTRSPTRSARCSPRKRQTRPVCKSRTSSPGPSVSRESNPIRRIGPLRS